MVAPPPLLPLQNQNAPDDFPLALTLPGVPVYSAADAESDIAWALAAFAHRRDTYALYDQYVRGIHRPLVATQAYESTFRALLARTSANVCPAVVRALTDRLKVTGFSPHGVHEGHTPQQDEAQAAAAWSFWQDRRLARVANWAHGQAVALGDAYLVVWPDSAGMARVYAHGGDAMVARFDPERPEIPTVAARMWEEPPTYNEGRRYRVTLYYADRIEKYQSGPAQAGIPTKAESFMPYREAGEPWPVRNPWGRVPVFPLAFEGGPGRCGRSALAEVVPLQDSLNKAVVDRAIAQEFGAFRQRYAIGLEPDYDASGNPLPLPLKTGVDRLLTVANADAKFGEFSATDLGPYTETIMSFLDLIATVTGIPPHLLHRGIGTPPSGEALKTSETRLVARVEDTQTDFGAVWEDAIAFALAVEGQANTHFVADWRSPVSRAEKEHAETMGILRQQAGLPLAEILDLMDYPDQKKAEILAADQAEQAFAADLVAGDGSASLTAELNATSGQGQ